MLFRAEETEKLHSVIDKYNIKAEWLDLYTASVPSEQVVNGEFACNIISDRLKDLSTPFYLIEFIPNKSEAYAEFVSRDGGMIKETYSKDGLLCLLGKAVKDDNTYYFKNFAQYIGSDCKTPIPNKREEIIASLEEKAKYLFDTDQFYHLWLQQQECNHEQDDDILDLTEEQNNTRK